MPNAAEFPGRRAAPDEQRRLRWLAEDLAACLAGLGAIAARLSQTNGLPGPTRILVMPPGADGGPRFGEAGAVPPPDGPGQEEGLPIASVAWMWDDGLRVEYDWKTEVCRTSGPEPDAPDPLTR
jgi:hypothetical protein